MKPRKPMARKAPKVKGPSLNHPDRKPEVKTRKKVKAVSSKRAEWLKIYRAKKKELGEGPFACVVCSQTVLIGRNGSWHHPSARRTLRTLLTIVPIHEIPCHHRVHENEKWALENGYLTTEFFRSLPK